MPGNRRKNFFNSGYTLLELIVVIAGLGILASLAIPNYLKFLEESKNDEAAAFMNAAASECLQLARMEPEPLDAKFKTPAILERNGPPQGFEIAKDDRICGNMMISPSNPSDTLISAIRFRLKFKNKSAYIYKEGNYSHPEGEPACTRWANFKEDNNGNKIKPETIACTEGGDVAEIRIQMAAEAAEREKQRQIEDRFQAWLAGPPLATGNYTADGKNIWAFNGRLINGGKDAFDKEVEAQCGQELVKALDVATKNKQDGPFSYTGKSGGCSVNTYLCSGADVKTKDGYDACKIEERETSCKAALGRWDANTSSGRFSDPNCFEPKFKCGGVFVTEAAFNQSCGAPPTVPQCTPPANPPWYCPYTPDRAECKCR